MRFEEPIGNSSKTVAFDATTGIEQNEQEHQKEVASRQLTHRISALQSAMNEVIVQETEQPDFKKLSTATTKALPLNADEKTKESIPVLIYPELSTVSDQIEGYKIHPTAGAGTAFAEKKDDDGGLRLLALPLPASFHDAIATIHIASQEVDYLPQVPNLSDSRSVGRVKPRSAVMNWMAINFDTWSAGKSPLHVEFIPSLTAKEHEFLGSVSKGKVASTNADGTNSKNQKDVKEAAMMELIQSLQIRITKDAFINVDDDEGLNDREAAISMDQIMEEEFKKLPTCKVCRGRRSHQPAGPAPIYRLSGQHWQHHPTLPRLKTVPD